MEKHNPDSTNLFYNLRIEPNFPNTNNIIGKIKNEINLEEVKKLPLCHHNEDAFEYMLKTYNWARNYVSDSAMTIFNCHVIDYVIPGADEPDEPDNPEKHIKIHILFFSLKNEELLIPSVITSDNSIITIINRHIMIYNNFTNIDYHNYSIELLCKELDKDRLLDLRFQPPEVCKTLLWEYQRDNIQWMLDIEINPPLIKFVEHKVFYLGTKLNLYFDYNKSSKPTECFITTKALPEYYIRGGMICDEPGLGKTVQCLNLAFSMPIRKTLIIVPNHIKSHWENEVAKHFDFAGNMYYENNILIVSFAEFGEMSLELIAMYERVIVDEIHEMYALENAKENNKLFIKLLDCQTFKYRWGVSATPFVDNMAMFNIIKYLLGTNKIYNTNIGNYIMNQAQFRQVFHRNTKLNVSNELNLPEIKINNILLDFFKDERIIYDAEMIGNENKNILFLREICCNVLIAICKDIKNTITPAELKKLTLNKFQERIDIEQQNLNVQFEMKANIIRELETTESHSKHSITSSTSSTSITTEYLSQYKQRLHHIEINIDIQQKILERRINVYESYKAMTDNIEDILLKTSAQDNVDDNAGDMEYNPDTMCPVCYNPYSNSIALFINCRHYFCHQCFEVCHKTRPNQCPTCRTQAEVGEINFIGNNKQVFTSTKNTEILRLINTIGGRFIIFTQFDKLIKSISYLLQSNDISALTYPDFSTASQEEKDKTQVVILSSTANASGIDMSFIHNVIIMEPFENYIYGKEIEKQLIGRVHRINQIQTVNVYRLIIKNTIEEQIYSM